MHVPPVCRPVVARLVGDSSPSTAAGRRRLYRPLVVGAAILRRPRGSTGRWQVRLAVDASIRPCRGGVGPRLAARLGRLRAAGIDSRLAAALVAPEDIRRAAAGPETTSSVRSDPGGGLPGFADPHRFPRRFPRRRGRIAEFYGWALLYVLPGCRGIGFVDPHESFVELPAFYESPLELLDRAAFLAGKGVITRPLAMLTRPEDFVAAAAGPGSDGSPAGAVVNRFFPRASFAKPVDLDWLE